MGITGLGEADQRIRGLQNMSVSTSRHAFCPQLHALSQTHHPYAWLELGSIDSSRAVTNDRTEFRDKGTLFQKQGQNTVARGIHSIHGLSQLAPLAMDCNTKGHFCLCRKGIVIGFCIDSQIRIFQFVRELLLGVGVQQRERMNSIETEGGRNICQRNLKRHQECLPNDGRDCADVPVVGPHVSLRISR